MQKNHSAPLSRRHFLKVTAASAMSAGLFPAAPPAWLASALKKPSQRSGPLRVALIATEVRRHSHAQHFIDRFLEGYGWQGRHYHPAVKLVSLYVDQFPEGDLSRDRSRRFQV